VKKIDPDAFAIIVRNLIKNALVHGDLSEPVLVKTDASSLRISNKGSVVSSNILKTLGVRFARGDTDADGNGLGLAIIKTICDQVGAQITFSSPRLDQQDGFEVHIHF
jgi:two-component system OmpR family sensor kinase